MKVTNRDVFNAREALQSLLKLKPPVLTAYAIAKLAKAVNGQLQIIEDVRVPLVAKYGVTDDKGQTRVAPEHLADFSGEFHQVLDQPVELDVVKVNIAPLEGAIEPGILLALDPFIELIETAKDKTSGPTEAK